MDNSNQPIQAPQENHETLKVSASSDPHHFPKMLLIGLGAFLIIIIGGGIGYFFGLNSTQQTTPEDTNQIVKISPTPIDETANPDSIGASWKIYTSASGNFSIKYPSEWIYVAGGSISTGTETITFGQNVSGVTEDINSKMSIQMQKVSSSTEIVDAESYKDAIIKGKGSSATVVSAIVDNVNGFKITYVDTGTKIENIIFDKNNLIYSIMFGQHGKSLITIEDQNIFDQILSTFQFTDQ